MENQYIPWMVSRNFVRTYADFLLMTDLSSGCDIPTHLYSFSFNLNPNWSKELCDRQEILDCKPASADHIVLF